jgi:pyocin large subunit-like protein
VSAAASHAARALQAAARRNAQPQELTIIQTPMNLPPKPSNRKLSKPAPKVFETAAQSASISGPSSLDGRDSRPFQHRTSLDNFANVSRELQSHDVNIDTIDRSHVPEPGLGHFYQDADGNRASISPVKVESGVDMTDNFIRTTPEYRLGETGTESLANQGLYNIDY